MATRTRWLAVALMVLICSCGSGSTPQSGSIWEEWNSESFGGFRVSADGRFFSTGYGSRVLIFTRELSPLGEFSSEDYPGKHGGTFLGTSSVGPGGYCLYITTAVEAEGGGDGTEQISCLDDTGATIWSALLDPEFGTSIGGLAVGFDSTHYLLDQYGIQTIDSSGEQRWVARVDAQQLVIAQDGRLYARGKRDISALMPDGEIRWERSVEELAGTKHVLEYPRLFEAGPSLLVVFSTNEIFAFNDDGEPQWSFVDSSSNAQRDYMGPVISTDGRLYFLLTEKRWLTEPYQRHEWYRWLGAIDTQTGQLVLDVLLADADVSMLGINDAGSIVIASRPGGHVFDTLNYYSPDGVLLSQRGLTHPAEDYIGVVRNVPALSPQGVIYYQSTTETAPNREDNLLVAIDLAGNVLGTVVSLEGEWVLNFTMPEPSE